MKKAIKEKDNDMEIIKLILANNKMKTCKDVSNILDNMFGKIVQTLLDAEMEDYLGYEKGKHEVKDTDNRRNGVSSKNKKVKTDTGEIYISTPRDRNGEFEPEIVKKRQRVLEGMDDTVISMYAKGLSLKDVGEMIKGIYKIDLSIETLSNLTSAVSEEVIKWQQRPLDKFYPFVYVDCLYCYLKEDLKSEKRAVYVMLAINAQGIKEVLGIWLDNTESAHFWLEAFEDIKSRGVEKILFVSMDGLAGLSEAIEKVYPKTRTQRCIVHIVRNIYASLNKKEAKQVIGDFKKIYTAPDKSNAMLEYENFREKYKENKKLIKKVSDIIDNIFQLFDYTNGIRKVIYTTNPIESLNSALRKVTKGKGAFINKEALLKVLYLRIKALEKKWSKGIANWAQVRIELIEVWGEEVLQYME